MTHNPRYHPLVERHDPTSPEARAKWHLRRALEIDGNGEFPHTLTNAIEEYLLARPAPAEPPREEVSEPGRDVAGTPSVGLGKGEQTSPLPVAGQPGSLTPPAPAEPPGRQVVAEHSPAGAERPE